MNLTDSLRTWIDSSLSSPVSFLGNLPPCPFAREAMLNKKIEILSSNSINMENDLVKALNQFPKNKQSEMQIVAIDDWQNCEVTRVQNLIYNLREKYFRDDIWILYDHPQLSEVIEGFSFNHGSLLLFMIQKLSHLVRASNDLHAIGYYKNWPQAYYAEVVGYRKKYYDRLLDPSIEAAPSP